MSAIYMLFFVIFLLAFLGLRPVHDYAQWRAWIARPAVTLAFVLFVVALLSHMWVGLRDVLLDYARPARVRNVLLVTLALGLTGVGVSMLSILMRLHG